MSLSCIQQCLREKTIQILMEMLEVWIMYNTQTRPFSTLLMSQEVALRGGEYNCDDVMKKDSFCERNY